MSDAIRTMPYTTSVDSFARRVYVLRFGIVFAVLTQLIGFGFGVAFGAGEDLLKERLQVSGEQVLETAYGGDRASLQSVLARSWAYLLRAHLHAGSLGTAALALIIVLATTGMPRRLERVTAGALGLGGLGYAMFWMLAGFLAPGMGGTGAAKDALRWLAWPSSGAFVLATVLVLVLFVVRSAGKVR